MRGTDPTKSKWECPTMFYVCFRRNSPFFYLFLSHKVKNNKKSDVSLNKMLESHL